MAEEIKANEKALDVIKSFDEEVSKNQASAEAQTSEDVAKTDTVLGTDTVEKSTEDKKEDDKTEDTEKSDTEDEDTTEKSAEDKDTAEDTEKSDTEDEDTEDTKKSETDKEDEDKKDTEKSVVDFEALLNVVVKSYAQLASQTSAIQAELAEVKSTQTAMNKSLDGIAVASTQPTPTAIEDLVKSVDDVEVTEGKAVGYLEKSSVIDDDVEPLEKSASNVETAPVNAVTSTYVEELFKSKFAEASTQSSNARDENKLREISKSWGRYINDRATTEDTDRINHFINN